MLGGIDPILIFNFPIIPEIPQIPLANAGIPIASDSILSSIGVPVPIYLSEAITGIIIESETRGLDVRTNTDAKVDGKTPTVEQVGLDNVITINMVASRSNVVLTVLLSLCDLAFSRVISKQYGISYLSGSTIVFNGLLKGFNTSASNNDDLVHITLEISKANQKGTSLANPVLQVNAVQGAIPLAGG